MSNQLAQEDSSATMPDSAGVRNTSVPGMDNRDASVHMLALYPATFPDTNPASATCRHFRNQVPRELADELRDNDPEPCYLCDTMPHRRNRGIAPIADHSPV